ncbi:hypothetical protein F9B85_11760 [Heliorestis acidaminivorans]|uniref:Uncharacterized protein n=1 Tax=Heliorestis acidaminivorans TaxID=553427 RepID=A0A6I0EV39_9FIRM|nr:hypothetical protein [Heliorestis acidaminivorans]KAB2951698.1 hypothetical protein F9B85_11760 [Heliorestis acidaminivorans]
MVRRKNYIVARSLGATTATTNGMIPTADNNATKSNQNNSYNELPEYGQATQGTDTAVFGSVRPTFEIYPGE